MTHADIFTRLSGTTGSSAAGQSIAAATAAAPVYSTNYIDLDHGRSVHTKRELRDLYALAWPTTTVDSATDTATLDIELVMMPYTALPAAAGTLTAFNNTTEVNATVITSTAHGLANGTPITVAQTTGTLNTSAGGYAVNTLLYIVNATTNTFGVSATIGGPAISLTDQTGTTVVTYYSALTFDNTKSVNAKVITIPSHGLTNGTRVTVAQTTGAINTELAISTNYFIVAATTDTFGLAATPGGAAISLSDTTGTTVMTWYPEVVGAANKIALERLIANVAQVQFAINPLILGPGNGTPVHRYLMARYTPSANLTAGVMFLDLRSGAPMRNFPINPNNYTTP